jgi:hypothetical protein
MKHRIAINRLHKNAQSSLLSFISAKEQSYFYSKKVDRYFAGFNAISNIFISQ